MNKYSFYLGMPQVDLSVICNTEKSSINRIEAGRTNPTSLTLKALAEGLEVDVSAFFNF